MSQARGSSVPRAGSQHHTPHYHHKITTREKAIERHNPGHTSGYPFMGDYKVERGVSHGHSPRPPVAVSHASSLVVRISGNNVVVDEISIPPQESLSCSIGEVDPRQPLQPQTKSLSDFTFTGQRLSFPDNAKSYCLASQVKNSRTHAVHNLSLVVCSSKDGTAASSRPGTPRNTPREALALPSPSDYRTVRVKSDPGLGVSMGVSGDGHEPLLLTAGGSVDVGVKQPGAGSTGPSGGEITLVPPADGTLNNALDALLAQKQLVLTSTTMPLSLKFQPQNAALGGDEASSAASKRVMVQPGVVTKVPVLDAMHCSQCVIETPSLPELDFSFAVSGDGVHTIFAATIGNFDAVAGWRLCLSVANNAALRAESTDGSCVLQFPATSANDVSVAVWGPTAPLLSQKVRVPALKFDADDDGSKMAASATEPPQVSVTVRDGGDSGNPAARNIQVSATPPESLSVSASADATHWYPGLPGINVADPLKNPVVHLSLLDRAQSRKVAQLRIDLAGLSGGDGKGSLSSMWIKELAARLAPGGAGLGDDAGAVAATFESLTPPTQAEERGLLLALQGELVKALGKAAQAPVVPRFSLSYAPPSAAAGEVSGRFENLRCEGAQQLSVQTGGPGGVPCTVAPGTSVQAPRPGDSFPTVVTASDFANKALAVLELRESNNNSHNGAGGGDGKKNAPPELSFGLGGEPNTITGFYCSEPTARVQVTTSDGSAPPRDVDFRSVVDLNNPTAQKTFVRAVDAATGAVLAQTALEGNRSLGSRNMAEYWAQVDQTLVASPDASGLRSLKPGGDPWLEELLRVLRQLVDPRRSFEIRYRGNKPGEAATVEASSLQQHQQRCTEAEPVKVLISDRIATVVAPPQQQQGGISPALLAAIENNVGSAEAMRAALTAATTQLEGPADERLHVALLRALNNFLAEKARAAAAAAAANSSEDKKAAVPLRFSLPRGAALRNVRCGREDAVLYATINGKRDRMSPGEAMPPAALTNHCDTMELEAVVLDQQNHQDEQKRQVVSHVICSFNNNDGSGNGNGPQCVGFDCEVIPDGDEAVMNLTAPNGYQIAPRVDGLKGNALGSRGVVRLDPCTSHVVQVTLSDPTGLAVLKQSLFLPRFALPRTEVFVDGKDGSVGVQCPRGIRVVAAVDGGAERNTDTAVQIDADKSHLVALRFLGEALSREGSREMCRIGEVALKLPPIIAPMDVLELLRLLREHDPASVGSAPLSRLVPKLAQLSAGTRSNVLRDITTSISSIVDRGGGVNVSLSGEFQRPPVAPVPQRPGSADPQSRQATPPIIVQQQGSRPNTPSIQFRLSGDQNNDDVDGALP